MVSKRKLVTAAVLLVSLIAQYIWQELGVGDQFKTGSTGVGADTLSEAFERKQSDVQIQGEGEVVSILSDDNEGSRHQRFILGFGSGQTVLVAHNIDLAPRIDAIRKGDLIEFYGEYEWNSKGGVIHWTHHDPRGNHVDGWLKHEGKTYK